MKKLLQYIKYQYWLFRSYSLRSSFPKLKVLSVEATIKEIIKNRKSISRLGDADFLLLIEERDVSYQKLEKRLSEKLGEVLLSSDPNFLVAIAEPLVNRKNLTQGAKAHWVHFINQYNKKLQPFFSNNKVYANSNITRYYIDTLNIPLAYNTVALLKKIWDNKNIIIVEGEYSRLGIGNDLFSNADSLYRIICPGHNAFDVYDSLLSYFENHCSKDNLYLFSLGPTATVLCYELHKQGFWCVDIGNVDIEYMWLQIRAKEKISIRGRYHVETDNSSFEELNDEELNEYNNSILCKINV